MLLTVKKLKNGSPTEIYMSKRLKKEKKWKLTNILLKKKKSKKYK
jgi:hypothetical protein